jgi:hypothetical protein
MPTSRLMTSTVSQIGMRFTNPMSGSVRTMKVVTRSSLSAAGSSHAPNSLFCPARRALRPSSASVRPAIRNVKSAHPNSPYTTSSTKAGISSIRSSVSWFAIVNTGPVVIVPTLRAGR